ncbi:MAG: NUDIX domain-containing protein [Clostridia bacterium]|nr:NUDIX domain-containing protein [Clostridia bacterium]
MNYNKSLTATVYIVNGGRVLLHLHKKYMTWFPVGGHLGEDELPHEAASREVKEETGWTVDFLPTENVGDVPLGRVDRIPLPFMLCHEGIGHDEEFMDFIYIAVTDSVVPCPGPGESREFRWFSREDLEEMSDVLKPHIKNTALAVLDRMECGFEAAGRKKKNAPRPTSVPSGKYFAVIDTETNWNDAVMSVGVAIGEASTFTLVEKAYYIIMPEASVGGMYEDRMVIDDFTNRPASSRKDAINGIRSLLGAYGITSVFAYNALFDFSHLPELSDYKWFDILFLAARRQYNKMIPDCCECYSTGRMKRGYGAEDILRMLSGNLMYHEKHNGLFDAVDELKIMELLGQPYEAYSAGFISKKQRI